MKKITQNLTKLTWHSSLLAVAFLFSLTINAQVVGQEYLTNPGVNTTNIDPDTGYTASGNFNQNGNGNYGGWDGGAGGAYAGSTGANGQCHSPDRQFKFFKVGGASGQYVNQTMEALPAGNYNFGFWNRWDATNSANEESLPTWSADGDSTPKFVIKVQDAEGAWVNALIHIPAEPTADDTWTQETGTWTNDETRDVRVQFYKNGGTSAAPGNLNNLWYVDTTTFNYASELTETSSLEWQGVLDFSLPGKYFRGFHLKATADIADLSVYSMETYSSGDRLTANNVYTLSGSASAGDDILFWMSNADNAANLYMNASGIFDVVVEESGWSGYNGDDPLTFSMNGTVLETYGELGVDGSGLAWEYTDTWAYKVDGAWTHGVPNCTDGSYYTWDSGCAYPLAVDQQATGASTDLATTFSENMNVVPSGGFWYNEGEAPIERKTASFVPGSDTPAMMYTDTGEFAYSNMQIQFTSKVDMSSMNTYTMDVYVDAASVTGTAPVNLALKLQDSSESTPWTNQNVIIQDITADTWTTLTFAFNDDASMARDDVDRIVVQFNGEGNNDPVVAYIKNVVGSYTEPVATLYTDVTFTVNTSTIEVGPNGMYLGGGIIGDATAHAMSDADGDGTWEVTLSLQEGVTGNYIFLNSPNDGGDWGAKENLVGQECADGQYSDRLLAPVGADDYTLQHCFGSCESDGTCPTEPTPTTDVTFTVNTSTIEVGPNGMYLGGGVIGAANEHAMSDADGDGTWEVTLTLNEGTTGNYIFLNSPNDGGDWGAKEDLVGQECADGQYSDRLLAPVGADDYTLQHCFGSCESDGSCPAPPSDDPTCTHTLYMVDSYGDGWNGNTVDVLVNGVVVLEGQTIASGSAAEATFQASTGDVITLTWVEGTYTSEVSWSVTDGEGTEIAAGAFGADAAGTGYCTPPSPCPHTLYMVDSYGDGWNGNSVDVLVNGVVVLDDATIASGSAAEATFEALTGDAITITWTEGTYTSEVSWSINDGAGTEIAAGAYGADTGGALGNCPSCLPVTDLTVSDISATGAIVSWVSDGSQFMIEIQPAGSPQGTEGGYTIGDVDAYPLTSVDLTGYLADNTAYDIYVINVCGDISSSWAGPASFTTLALPIVPDYTNDFSEYPGDLWTEGAGAFADGFTGTASGWSADTFANDGVTAAAKVNIYGTLIDEWLISPQFDLSGGTFYLNMRAGVTPWNGTTDGEMGADDLVHVLISEDSGSTWTILHTWDSTNTPLAAGSNMPEVDLSSYTGLAHFALYGESTVTGGDIDFFIDDFSVGSTSLGVDDIEALQFSLFPNPVNNILTIKAQASIDSITIYNMLGQTVVTSTPNTNNSTIDMSALQTGAYFVQVSINNTLNTVRVIKN